MLAAGFRESRGIETRDEKETRRKESMGGEERRLLASCEELPTVRSRREAEEAEQRADISAAGSC